jgi:CheY-like chemotaxis protein
MTIPRASVHLSRRPRLYPTRSTSFGCFNGRIGLALYRSRPADLVITDMLMPKMNRLDVFLELTRLCICLANGQDRWRAHR